MKCWAYFNQLKLKYELILSFKTGLPNNCTNSTENRQNVQFFADLKFSRYITLSDVVIDNESLIKGGETRSEKNCSEKLNFHPSLILLIKKSEQFQFNYPFLLYK